MKFFISAGFLCIIFCAIPVAHAKPTLIIGDATVRAGNKVIIPIDFENEGAAVGIQFDLFLPIEEIQEVDVGDCFTRKFKKNTISACRHKAAPNHDVVRYLLVNSDLSPLPSGRLVNLVIHTKQDAYSGRYRLSIAASTALASPGDGNQVAITTHSGNLELTGGQLASTRPPEFEPVLFAASSFAETRNQNFNITGSFSTNSDFELLADNPSSLTIRLPNDKLIGVERKGFEANTGFVPRIGSDEPLRDPSMLATERSYFWRGSDDHTDARFTIHKGFVRGTINSPEGMYTVIGPFEDVAVALVNSDNLPPSDDGIFHNNESIKAVEPTQVQSEIAQAYSVTNVVIDVLVMFTGQARTDAGGTTGLNALIAESMNNLNAATLDGGVESVSFNHVGTQQLFGFVPSGIELEDVIDDLRDIRLDTAVRAARDSANADIVIVLLRNFFDAQQNWQLGACGASFIQNKLCSPNTVPPDSNCTVGEAYEDYAYGWVSVYCANLPQRNSFPHEIGHIMGGEHQYTPEGTQPNDLSFPWSRGYGNITENISTLMYTPDATPIHYIQFSNPRVQINGFDSGVDGQSENAATVFSLAPIVAGFRGPASEVIFRDSLETGVP